MSELMREAGSSTAMDWLIANYQAPQDGPCVLWPFKAHRGYGRIGDRSAHAIATELREGPAPADKPIAIHGECHNSLCIIHTRWGTYAENQADRLRDGTDNRGERNGIAKLTANEVRAIRERAASGQSQQAIADDLGITQSNVSAIVLGKSWGWLK